jgi:hypothetical protein
MSKKNAIHPFVIAALLLSAVAGCARTHDPNTPVTPIPQGEAERVKVESTQDSGTSDPGAAGTSDPGARSSDPGAQSSDPGATPR